MPGGVGRTRTRGHPRLPARPAVGGDRSHQHRADSARHGVGRIRSAVPRLVPANPGRRWQARCQTPPAGGAWADHTGPVAPRGVWRWCGVVPLGAARRRTVPSDAAERRDRGGGSSARRWSHRAIRAGPVRILGRTRPAAAAVAGNDGCAGCWTSRHRRRDGAAMTSRSGGTRRCRDAPLLGRTGAAAGCARRSRRDRRPVQAFRVATLRSDDR